VPELPLPGCVLLPEACALPSPGLPGRPPPEGIAPPAVAAAVSLAPDDDALPDEELPDEELPDEELRPLEKSGKPDDVLLEPGLPLAPAVLACDPD